MDGPNGTRPELDNNNNSLNGNDELLITNSKQQTRTIQKTLPTSNPLEITLSAPINTQKPRSTPNNIPPSERLPTYSQITSHGTTSKNTLVSIDPSLSLTTDLPGEVLRTSGSREEMLADLECQTSSFFNKQTHFPQFFIINFPGLAIHSDMNIMQLEVDLLAKIGSLARMAKQSRSSILIQIKQASQISKVNSPTSLAGHSVTVSLDHTLSHARGIVRSKAMTSFNETQLLDRLSPQGVSHITRLSAFEQGSKTPSTNFILTFKSSTLPALIRLSQWHCEIVDQYVPSPMRCRKCQKLGHSKNQCRSQQSTCETCGQPDHSPQRCQTQPNCINCGEQHKASSSACPHYILRKDILKLQAKEKLPFREAKARIRTLYASQSKKYDFTTQITQPTAPTTGNARTEVPITSDDTLPMVPNGQNSVRTTIDAPRPPSHSENDTQLPHRPPKQITCPITNQLLTSKTSVPPAPSPPTPTHNPEENNGDKAPLLSHEIASKEVAETNSLRSSSREQRKPRGKPTARGRGIATPGRPPDTSSGHSIKELESTTKRKNPVTQPPSKTNDPMDEETTRMKRPHPDNTECDNQSSKHPALSNIPVITGSNSTQENPEMDPSEY